MNDIKEVLVDLMKVRQNFNNEILTNFDIHIEDHDEYAKQILSKLDLAVTYISEAADIAEIMKSDIFFEGEIMEKISLSRFKKRYHYDPNKKTIIVDGETYKTDLDNYKSPYIVIRDKNGNPYKKLRTTSTTKIGEEPEIFLDKSFFNIKTKKRQDAVLYHEIGHSKLHNIDPKNPHLDKTLISPSAYMQILNVEYKEICNELKRKYGVDEICAEDKKEIFSSVRKSLPPKDEYVKEMTESQLRSKMRAEMMRVAKRYVNQDKNNHMNIKEIEADRYAANKTSESSLKKGLNDYQKYRSSPKEIKRTIIAKTEEDWKEKSPEKANLLSDKKEKAKIEKMMKSGLKKDAKEMSKEQRKYGKEDIAQRGKALKDKQLRDSKAYK